MKEIRMNDVRQTEMGFLIYLLKQSLSVTINKFESGVLSSITVFSRRLSGQVIEERRNIS